MVSNVTVRNGTAGRGGDIVSVLGGWLTHSRVINNTGDSYGASAVDQDGGVIRACLFATNSMIQSVGDVGGGVFTNNLVADNTGSPAMNVGGSGLAVDCRILRNGTLASTVGGMASLTGGTLRNSLVTGNRAKDEAGLRVSGSGLVENCTVAENTISSDGDGKGAGLTISGGLVLNSIFSGNANIIGYEVDRTGGMIEYCCADVSLDGEGNLAGDPGFDEATAGDFSLTAGSVCRDSGFALPWMAGAGDLAGAPRVVGGAVDRGAFEAGDFSSGPLSCDFSASAYLSFSGTLSSVLQATAGGEDAAEADFAWDLDGDGEYDDAGGATISPEFGPGFHAIGLKATAGEATATRVRENIIKVYPLEIFVSKGGSGTAPFHSWETAAGSVVDALNVARSPGYTLPRIVTISNGTYAAQNLLVDVPVTIRGVGPAPAILDGQNLGRIMTVQHPGALLAGLTFYRGKIDMALTGADLSSPAAPSRIASSTPASGGTKACSTRRAEWRPTASSRATVRG